MSCMTYVCATASVWIFRVESRSRVLLGNVFNVAKELANGPKSIFEATLGRVNFEKRLFSIVSRYFFYSKYILDMLFLNFMQSHHQYFPADPSDRRKTFR